MNNLLFSNPLKKGLQTILALIVLLFSLGPSGTRVVHAAPPSNDTRASATVINSLIFTPPTFSTTEATPPNANPLEPADPDNIVCDSDPDIPNLNAGYASVWYSYVPDINESISLDTLGTDYDTYIAVWTVTSGNLNLVICNDDTFENQQSELFFTGNAGTTYYIEIAQFSYYEGDPRPTPPIGGNLQFHAYITNINVTIGVTTMGKYYVPTNGSLRRSYADVDSGPVKVENTASASIIAAVRNAWSQNGVVESWAQLMGLAETQLSTAYYFPAYNNVTLSDQLRFANLGNAQTTVNVKIGSVVNQNYVLQAGESLRVSYPGVDTGPMTVSSNGQLIIAALRNAWSYNGIVESWVQLMGLSASQLSTAYYFPAYNNVTLSDQLRFANLGAVPTTVTVKIGSVINQSYVLQAGESLRVSYPGVDSGPVTVSSDGQLIIAAVRNAWSQNGVVQSWAQLMGLPWAQLSTTYYFPAYNNVTLSDQLRFANLGAVPTTVNVKIGSVVNQNYVLQAGESLRVSYPGVDSGPMTVSSNGQLIIAALRNAWSYNGIVESWVQLMGLPASQLSDTYYFPAYNNVTLSDQLRFAVP